MQRRTAFVTGSTQGIGLAIARSLAAAGHNLVLNGLASPEEGHALAASLASEFGVAALFHGADLADVAQIDALADTALARFGRIEILVNNAGVQHTASVVDMPPERWERIIAINLSAAFHTMRRCIPGMVAGNWGRIVNIASVHGLVASVNKAPYVAAKHGLIGLTRVAALENATHQITVNAICPGWVETPLIEPQIQARAAQLGIDRESAVRDLLSEKQPSLRTTKPDEIAALILFLCSEAAGNITGTAIPIDGGWTAQ